MPAGNAVRPLYTAFEVPIGALYAEPPERPRDAAMLAGGHCVPLNEVEQMCGASACGGDTPGAQRRRSGA